MTVNDYDNVVNNPYNNVINNPHNNVEVAPSEVVHNIPEPLWYKPQQDGYVIDYTDVGGTEDQVSSSDNKELEGNNAVTTGNVSDERQVGDFLNKNIFGGLSEKANPGESLS